MADIAKAAENLMAQAGTANPSQTPKEEGVRQRNRIPMTAPMGKLHVPKIPGFHLQWIRGDGARIQQALNAGFTFVTPDEVGITNRNLGDDVMKTGNTDLGNRVSIVDGSDVGPDNQAIRMYLMKQSQEHHLEDRAIIDRQNDGIANALTRAFKTGTGLPNPTGEAMDSENRYVDTKRSKVPELFRRKH